MRLSIARWATLFLAALPLAAQPAAPPGPAGAAAASARVDIPYTQFSLPNGLNVILHEDHTVPLVAVDVWYHVGSARELPGRTGLAHLFEHILFEGSKHVKTGEFDTLLEAAGGDNNGSTNNDRTNYFEVLPSNSLELALFLESDRMGYLLDVMSAGRVDQQRDVVKNERRQRYENQPYGLLPLKMEELLFPAGHPYHWPVIGSMEDLTAATHEDIASFFKSYYRPNNATLAVAGDFRTEDARRAIEHWFSDVPGGKAPPPFTAAPAALASEQRLTLEDRVQLPRLAMAWVTPAEFHPGDDALDILASVLASGKNSRLYKRLVYDLRIAQDVSASQDSRFLASVFEIVVTAREGHSLTEIERVVQEELDRIKGEPPSARELERALHQYEASFYRALEHARAKADLLNLYDFGARRPDYANEDLARHLSLAPSDLQSAARRELPDSARVIVSVVPIGKASLAAGGPAQKGPPR
ncbi:MAG TPA: pitrilysin family protein [Thermoanaerobaculia bacterium]|nr:pitrilysin family protein [Thermoanaerobaculia bacterium]